MMSFAMASQTCLSAANAASLTTPSRAVRKSAASCHASFRRDSLLPAARIGLPRQRGSADVFSRMRSRDGRVALLTSAAMSAERVGEAYVMAPKDRRALGVVHFLGGAFVGAAPHLTYGLVMQILAEKGYTVIATPYKITFNHQDCATEVHNMFNRTLEELRQSGRSEQAPLGARIYGVGHSNGALLHLLIGSIFRVPNASNILISYNNKQVSDAIPIPGVLEGLREPVNDFNSRAEGNGSNNPGAEALRNLQGASLLDQFTANSLEPVVDQVGDVLQEVGDGATDFSPTPDESRAIVRESYSVASTLLVQFSVDSFDQTDEMAAILASKYPTGTRVLRLPGTHTSPLGQDFDIQGSRDFPPAYAAALVTKAVAQLEQRRLGSRMLSWMARVAKQQVVA